MTRATTLLPELDAIVKRGNGRRRAQAIRDIGDMFVAGASRFTALHIELFGDILTELVADSNPEMRAELSERLAPLGNAPPAIVIRLARDDEIRVAGPVLRLSPLIGDDILIEVARRQGQAHLLAIASRGKISAQVTDAVISRGGREVMQQVAGNEGARLSADGYAKLVRRASRDGDLAAAVGQRADIPPPLLRELIVGAVDLVRQRILAAVRPEKQIEVTHIIAEISSAPDPQDADHDFAPAERRMLALHRAGGLTEKVLSGFAQGCHYAECVAAVAVLSGVTTAIIDRLLTGERPDSILVLGKALGLDWKTVRALVLLRRNLGRTAAVPDLDRVRASFEHLAEATARRVLRFWQMARPAAEAAR
ncbi:MAG: DUF2336 domain-containing protein [Xanthobacteraceae bacterium]|nr:MAG: DUF2336 domain-containing protein [Xanthobacteraceae bacterium]